MRLCANLSLMFTEVAMVERFEAARAAGFDGVEIQFPDEEDVAALALARAAAGLPVVLINVPRGAAGQPGIAAWPGREAEFAAALETAAATARALGADKVNVLAGCPPEDAEPARCRDTLAANLRRAADRLDAEGLRVMVEPINPVDVPGFFLDGLGKALETLEQAAHPNLFLQFDLYHMALTEGDLPAAISRAGARIGHVQFADAPGRGAPGSGKIDFAAAMAALRATGYDGAVSAEYRPTGDTAAGLGWMEAVRMLMR